MKGYRNYHNKHMIMFLPRFSPAVRLVVPAALLCIALTGCAPMVPRVAAAPLAPAAASVEIVLPESVTFKLGTGYTRTLAAQSRWRLVGRLPQGSVYRSAGSVLTIEGRQMHEAYLVVQRDALVGFYLPAEAAFSPLDPAVNLLKGVFQ
jgi:hypothetical protein